jgi:hypothetical protein
MWAEKTMNLKFTQIAVAQITHKGAPTNIKGAAAN